MKPGVGVWQLLKIPVLKMAIGQVPLLAKSQDPTARSRKVPLKQPRSEGLKSH